MKKLLLVDDDDVLLRMYVQKFRLAGFEVDTAADGFEALEKVEPFKPDLILLDILMPKINGINVLKELKSKVATRSIPVILLTNVSKPDGDTKEGMANGALAYLVKSDFTPDEVLQKVQEALDL